MFVNTPQLNTIVEQLLYRQSMRRLTIGKFLEKLDWKFEGDFEKKENRKIVGKLLTLNNYNAIVLVRQPAQQAPRAPTLELYFQ